MQSGKRSFVVSALVCASTLPPLGAVGSSLITQTTGPPLPVRAMEKSVGGVSPTAVSKVTRTSPACAENASVHNAANKRTPAERVLSVCIPLPFRRISSLGWEGHPAEPPPSSGRLSPGHPRLL